MVAEMEGAHGCVSTASGLAAITVLLLALTQAGDHLLVADTVYGPNPVKNLTVPLNGLPIKNFLRQPNRV